MDMSILHRHRLHNLTALRGVQYPTPWGTKFFRRDRSLIDRVLKRSSMYFSSHYYLEI